MRATSASESKEAVVVVLFTFSLPARPDYKAMAGATNGHADCPNSVFPSMRTHHSLNT